MVRATQSCHLFAEPLSLVDVQPPVCVCVCVCVCGGGGVGGIFNMEMNLFSEIWPSTCSIA